MNFFLFHLSVTVAYMGVINIFFPRQKRNRQASQLKRGSHLRGTSLAKALLILSENSIQMLLPTPSGVKTSALPT
jgi:hypothetical protein